MAERNFDRVHPHAPHAFEVAAVSFGYNGAAVLHEINLNVREGEFLVLPGPSGSGKTTLLRLLAGIERPAAGRIVCKGKIVSGPGIDRSMVFQDYSLFPWMNLQENICLAIGKAHPRMTRREQRELAGDYLTMVGLDGLGRKYPFELSGGMQQRVAIARAFATGSPFLLMDEPFGALDPINRAKLQDLLIDIWSRSSPGKTVLFVTHDMDEALYLGDRVVILGSFPGPVVTEIAVDFSRPRSRHSYLNSPELQDLRGRILAHFRQDAMAQMETVGEISGWREGI